MDDVRVARDAGGLVGLQLPDEMPRDRQVGALCRLGGGLLVTVFAEVPLAKLVEQPYIRSGPALGDGDERDLRGVTPRRGARGRDALPDLAQPSVQLGGPRRSPRACRTGWDRRIR